MTANPRGPTAAADKLPNRMNRLPTAANAISDGLEFVGRLFLALRSDLGLQLA